MVDKIAKDKAEPEREVVNSAIPERMDYDNLFKTVLHRYFWEALKIFVPELYEAADKSVEPVFLEQELQKITLDLGEGTNRTDLLVQIQLKNNRKELILCHLEVQGLSEISDNPCYPNKFVIRVDSEKREYSPCQRFSTRIIYYLKNAGNTMFCFCVSSISEAA
jgi:hypothetical protein